VRGTSLDRIASALWMDGEFSCLFFPEKPKAKWKSRTMANMGVLCCICTTQKITQPPFLIHVSGMSSTFAVAGTVSACMLSMVMKAYRKLT
jgi:hypothetical protein